MNGPLKFLTAFYLCSICSQNLNECSLARAPQIFALLASSQSKFFISARARKKIAVLGMLANARKDHSSSLGSKDGAVLRALTSHQRDPSSNPGVDAICGLSLLLVLSFAPRGFSPGNLVFPSP